MSELPPPRGARRRPEFAVVLIVVVLGLAVLTFPIFLFLLQSNDFGTGSKSLPNPPPPAAFGTSGEIGTHGDKPNPGALYHGAYPGNDQTQERRIGGPPPGSAGTRPGSGP